MSDSVRNNFELAKNSLVEYGQLLGDNALENKVTGAVVLTIGPGGMNTSLVGFIDQFQALGMMEASVEMMKRKLLA